MSKWILYSNAYNMIANSLKGGTVCLKAYKDFTCELSIKLLIDAYEDELFFSVTIHNCRSAFAIANHKAYTNHEITKQIIQLISTAANNALSKQTSTDEVTVELFDPEATYKNIKKNLALL